MDIHKLKSTQGAPHVLTRPIVDVDKGAPIAQANIGGLTIRVGEPFTPSLYWLGRYCKLLDPVWEYDVEDRWGQQRTTTEPPPGVKSLRDRPLDPYIMPVSVLEQRAEGDRLGQLATAVAETDTPAARKLFVALTGEQPSGDVLTAARTLLQLRGVKVESAPVEAPEPVELTDDQRADIELMLEDDDYNGMGRALKAAGLDVPSTKSDRMGFAAKILRGD